VHDTEGVTQEKNTLQSQVKVVVYGAYRFVVDEQGIVDKLSNKQELSIGTQCANPLGLVKQPGADGPIDKSLDLCRRCGKLIGLEYLKV
jgi:hypothetical protein